MKWNFDTFRKNFSMYFCVKRSFMEKKAQNQNKAAIFGLIFVKKHQNLKASKLE